MTGMDEEEAYYQELEKHKVLWNKQKQNSGQWWASQENNSLDSLSKAGRTEAENNDNLMKLPKVLVTHK